MPVEGSPIRAQVKGARDQDAVDGLVESEATARELMSVKAFEADDIETARAIGSQVLFEHRLAPANPQGQIKFSLRAARLGPIVAGLLSYGCAINAEISGADESYGVAVALGNPLEVRLGAKELVADTQTALVKVPSVHFAAQGWASPEDEAFLLRFDPHAFESLIRRVTGVDVEGPVKIKPDYPISAGSGALWWQLTRTVMLALRSPRGLAMSPLVGGPLSESLMLGLLLSADHPYREILAAPPREMWTPSIKRAVRIIEERAGEPLTISEIADQVGYSPRSLQLGFKKQLGLTPYEYLQRVRLDRAHAELLVGNPGATSVSEVASRWGFSHLSRFAAVYRHHYRRAPSRTLRDF